VLHRMDQSHLVCVGMFREARICRNDEPIDVDSFRNMEIQC
jgi:hypothetical protein